jgi:diguanylate cyclase (GGDEF)-like protein/PAS domain S-box-containing protein
MQDAISYEMLLDHLKDGVCVVGLDQRISFWNSGAERITGFTREEAMGKPYADGILSHRDKTGGLMFLNVTPVQTCLSDGAPREFELYLSRKDGALAPVFTRISPITDPRGNVIGALEVFSDNSSKVQALERIEELEELALVCPITGVGNRRYAEMALNNAIDELQRFQWPFGVMFIDVDLFKSVNDAHGHAIGDQVLRMVAHALRNSLRSFDFVGRWGGEEFLVTLPNITDDLLLRVAERCRASVEESRFQSGGESFGVTVSIGATMATPGEAAEGLLERADRLMYRSKATGRNRISTDA